MRKEVVADDSLTWAETGPWIDFASEARVRISSEDPEHPVEGALQDGFAHGWRAATPGAQTLLLIFDVPLVIRQIHLQFDAAEERTQEFVLLASTDGNRSYQEIVRQQFNFSLSAKTERENYRPNLRNVTGLKLRIVPDISGGPARATLRALRIQ